MVKKSDQTVFGIHAISEAILAGKEINKVFIRKSLKGELFQELFTKIREYGIPFQYVPVEKLNRLTRGNHQGVVAQLSLIEYKNLGEIITRAYEEGRDPFIIVLDQLTDVRNFGAIARSAECAGVDAIVVPERGSVTITPDAIKTSAGALNRIAVCRSKELSDSLNFIQENGIRCVAATEKTKNFYFSEDLSGPIAIVMGSEERGISSNILQQCDCQVKIPMHGAIGSLNVSVACGIVAYEVLRQRIL